MTFYLGTTGFEMQQMSFLMGKKKKNTKHKEILP